MKRLTLLIGAREAIAIHQILPDRLGVAASGQSDFDGIPKRFAGARRRAAARLR
jgi:hypothetical protein